MDKKSTGKQEKTSLTDLGKKHMPVIDMPERVKKDEPFEIKINVGKLLAHRNEPAHFIEWIELYCGDTFLARANCSGEASSAQDSFRVKLSHAYGPLKVRGKCNLHGLWKNTREINVV